jgi:hypothetical protein
MKTKSILGKLGMFISIILLANNLSGQVCTPNPLYTGSGIWPDTITNMDPACIGASYQMDFTINVPDDTIISGFTFIIDSVILNSISGLPAGFSYACSPANCRFLGNASSCFIVTGTPTVPLTMHTTHYWVTNLFRKVLADMICISEVIQPSGQIPTMLPVE